ncbi:MAG TPA: adenosine deaminase, partial [Thermoanaerobaculia bacterium]|nr:adenosine deaminase [Thermoanaerobaculia bacterium]
AATLALPPGARHPALDLLRAGVSISLSTDDPGLFGSTLRREFERFRRLGATSGELARVAAAAHAASLLSLPHRRRL